MPLTFEDVRVRVSVENGDAYDDLDKSQRGLEKQTKRTDRAMKGISSTLLNAASAVQVAQAGIAALRGAMNTLAKPVGLAISFEKEFALVRTLTDKAGKDLERSLLDLASRVPQTAGDITRSAYNAISAGISPEVDQLIPFLEAASKAAVAGNTEMSSVVSTLTTAVNAFGDQGVDAARAADILFGTVKAGVTDFQQLAAALPQGAALGKLGVSFEELNAAAATLTKTLGVPTAEAFTRVNAMVRGLTTAGGPMQKRLAALGVQTDIATLKNEGLAAMLAKVQKATNGNVEVFGTLSRRSEATQALIGLLGDSYSEFGSTLDRVTKSTGEASAANKIMQGTTQGSIDQLKALSEGVLRDLGNVALPAVRDGIEQFTTMLDQRGPQVIESFATIAAAVSSLTVELAGALATAIEFFDLVSGERARRAGANITTTARASTVDFLAGKTEEELARRRAKQEKARDEAFAAASKAQRALENLPQTAPLGERLDLKQQADEAQEAAQFAITQLRLLDQAQTTAQNRRGMAAAVDFVKGVDFAPALPFLGVAGEEAGKPAAAPVPPVPPVPPGPAGPAGPNAAVEFEKQAAAQVVAESAAAERQEQARIAQAEAQAQLDRNLTERRIAMIEHEGSRRLMMKAQQHEIELEQARAQGLETAELKRQQAAEMLQIVNHMNEGIARSAEQAAEAERAAYASSIKSNIDALGALADALELSGAGAGVFRAALLGAESVYHGFMAVGDYADAATAFANGLVPKGLAHTAAAIQHTAASIQAGSAAAKLGKGAKKATTRGGAGGAGGAGGVRRDDPGAGPRRPDVPDGGAGRRAPTTLVLQLNDLVLPPDPASLERAIPALAEAWERSTLTRGMGGLPGLSA